MRSRLLLCAVLLIVLSYTVVQAASKRPGAKPPVGPPPGSVARTHGTNAISTQLDRTTKQLEQLLKPNNNPAQNGINGSVLKSSAGVTYGSKSSTATAPRHLIGDPPLPGSFADLAAINTSSGIRRLPGATPTSARILNARSSPPSTTNASPTSTSPTWPNDLGTYLYTSSVEEDLRSLLPGEVRMYTGPLYLSGVTWGQSIYSQTVFNWDPTTRIGRNISWSSGFQYSDLFSPPTSSVYSYYYSPSLAPTPTPSPAPAAPSAPTLTVATPGTIQPYITMGLTNLHDAHIYLPADQTGQSTGLLTTRVGGVSNSSHGGQSGTVLTTEGSQVTYRSSSGYPGLSGSGQLAMASRFSPEDFTDDVYPLSEGGELHRMSMHDASEYGLSTRALSAYIPDVSPVSSYTIAEVIAGLDTGSSSKSFSEAPSAAGTAPSGQGQVVQSFRSLFGAYSERTTPILDESANPGSENVSVAQTGSSSSTRGTGSALPLAAAGLLLGAAALVGARKAISWNQDQAESVSSNPVFFVESSPPSPQQQQINLNLAVAKDLHQREAERLQDAIRYDTERAHEVDQELERKTETLTHATQKLQQDREKLQEEQSEVHEKIEKLKQMKERIEQLKKESRQLFEEAGRLWPWNDPFSALLDHQLPPGIREKVAQIQAELDSMGQELESLEQQISGLEKELANDLQELEDLKTEVAADQEKVSDLEGDIQSLKNEKLDLAADIAQKQAEKESSELDKWASKQVEDMMRDADALPRDSNSAGIDPESGISCHDLVAAALAAAAAESAANNNKDKVVTPNPNDSGDGQFQLVGLFSPMPGEVPPNFQDMLQQISRSADFPVAAESD
jgi:hypothetical protein